MPTHQEGIESLIAERDELRSLLRTAHPFLLWALHPIAERDPLVAPLRRRVNELCDLWPQEDEPCVSDPPSP